MKKLIRFLFFVLVSLVFISTKSIAVELEVPNYNQHDFNGDVDGDCAPTAASMLAAYWYKQGYNYLIPNPNLITTDLSVWADNYDGIKLMMENDFSFIMELNPNGGGTRDNEDVPKKINNGLFVLDSNVQFLVTAKSFDMQNHGQIFEYVKSKIDNGLPIYMSAKPNLYVWNDLEKSGNPIIVPVTHALVVKGYTSANSNNGNMLHVNMGIDSIPTYYIDADYLGIYYLDTWMNLYTITPSEGQDVGLYSDGWHYMYEMITGYQYINSTTYNTPSQPFVDAYIEAGGEDVFGLPWDNGGSIYVHAYPSETSDGKVYVQDFLYDDGQNNFLWYLFVYNDAQRKVYPLHGQILNFWLAYSGYFLYGAPMEAEHNEVDSNGLAIVVQKFQKGETVSYLGYCLDGNWLGEYTYENGEYVQVIITPQIDNIISMIAVPNFICNGVDAFAYLGSSPDTGQPVVSVVNPLNSSEMKNIIFLNSNARPKYFTILSDMNGNGFSEIHLTAYDVTNLGKLVEIRDSKTGAIIQ